MLGIYRVLLRLYPADYRKEFSSEMSTVLSELQADAPRNGLASLILLGRESAGLVRGALREHARALGGGSSWLSFPIRRFTMHPEFRFPKSTPILMTLILACIVWAIEKGKAIQASLPDVNPPIGPIHPSQHTFLPGIMLLFLFFYAAGFIGWAILHALRRSGVHRLAEMSAQQN